MTEPLTREQIEAMVQMFCESHRDDEGLLFSVAAGVADVRALADTALHYEARLREVEAERDEMKVAWERDNLCGICPYRKSIQARVAELEEALRLYADNRNWNKRTYKHIDPPSFARDALGAETL